MLNEGQPLADNNFAISLKKASPFGQYVQVMAFWSDYRLSDSDAWQSVRAMLKNLRDDSSVKDGTAKISNVCPEKGNGVSLLLGIEDARGLEKNIDRVDELYDMGIRVFTPLWAGETCIGGAHDTDKGLTDFGESAVRRAVKLGMIPDISHASVKSADEIFDIASEFGRPVIASHSNAYAICPVSRNLRDGQIKAIIDCHGLIGLNDYVNFLAKDHPATVEDLYRHADYLLSLGAEKALALGGDMDGADLPDDLKDLSYLPDVAECFLRHNCSENLVNAIFFENAYRVLHTALNRN